MKKKNNELNT